MKEIAELNRVNYANGTHHKELIRKQISPTLIDQIEISQNPSNNYKNAFKNVYQDELQKTVEEQREKKYAQKSTYLQPYRNGTSMYQNSSYPESSIPQNQSLSRVRQPFTDFQQQKMKRYNTLVEKQANQGHSFFRAQDQYQQKKQQQLKAANMILQQQLEMKQVQKYMGTQEYMKENFEVRENRRRQMELQMMEREKNKLAQQDLAYEIKGQMEKQRIKRHHKSILQLEREARHNPITNPIQYHIDNPYILSKIQMRENWRGQSD